MFLKNKNEERFGFYCSCGCNQGVVLKADKDDCGVFLSLVSDAFYLELQTGMRRFKNKCIRIWSIIRNKEYTYFNIYVDPDDVERFKEFVYRL